MTSALARRAYLKAAWSETGHSEFCSIYATQNGWKLPILFEEMGVPYDWAWSTSRRTNTGVNSSSRSSPTVGSLR